MGTDIYSSRGIVFTADEFLKVINGKNKSNVVDVCLGFIIDLEVDASQNPDDDWRQNLVRSFKALGGLKKSMKLHEIREIIASTVEVGGEVAKYGDCWVENSEYVEDLFTRILDACPDANDLPYIQEAIAIGGS